MTAVKDAPASALTLGQARVLVTQLRDTLHDLCVAVQHAQECGNPEPASLYDEEGVEGWRWTHRVTGTEEATIGSWNEPPPLHPHVDEKFKRALQVLPS